MDLGDPRGDGGGDLETSPLSLAIFVLMAEQVPCRCDTTHGVPVTKGDLGDP